MQYMPSSYQPLSKSSTTAIQNTCNCLYTGGPFSKVCGNGGRWGMGKKATNSRYFRIDWDPHDIPITWAFCVLICFFDSILHINEIWKYTFWSSLMGTPPAEKDLACRPPSHSRLKKNVNILHFYEQNSMLKAKLHWTHPKNSHFHKRFYWLVHSVNIQKSSLAFSLKVGI